MSAQSKEWYIGIDFGTCNTYIIAYEKTENKLYTNQTQNGWIINFTEKQNLNIPSVITKGITVNSNGEYTPEIYIGQKALEHPILRHFSGLKDTAREISPPNGTFGGDLKPILYPFSSCDLESKIEFGNDNYPLHDDNVSDLLTLFFKKILNIGNEIKTNAIKKIVLGCPVDRVENSTTKIDYKLTLRKIMKKVLNNCSNKKLDEIISIIPEPELASMIYFNKESDHAVLVIDIGGGTTDFSVIEFKKNNTRQITNIGHIDIAGNAIDNFIFEQLPDDIQKTKINCRNWKEQLFGSGNLQDGYKSKSTEELTTTMFRLDIGIYSKTKKSFFIGYNNRGSSEGIILSSSSSDSSIESIYKEIGKSLEESLKNATISSKIDTILFIGGTSIISPLRDHLIKIVDSIVHPTKKIEIITTFAKNNSVFISDIEDFIITHYNAVAVGAIIKALGTDNLFIVPSIFINISTTGNRSMNFTVNAANSAIIPLGKLVNFWESVTVPLIEAREHTITIKVENAYQKLKFKGSTINIYAQLSPSKDIIFNMNIDNICKKIVFKKGEY